MSEISALKSYINYKVPRRKIVHFLVCLFLVIFVIPKYFLKLEFTMLQQFFNILWYDILYWVMLKIEANIKNDDKE